MFVYYVIILLIIIMFIIAFTHSRTISLIAEQ